MSRSKQKGTYLESRVVTFLEPLFPDVERRAQAGILDRGDIRGVPNWAVEVKNRTTVKLAEWCAEATQEAIHAKCRYWVVIHNYPRHPTSQIHCTMPLWCFAELASGLQMEIPKADTPDDGKLFLAAINQFLQLYGHDNDGEMFWSWRIDVKPNINLSLGSWAAHSSRSAGDAYWAVIHRKRQAMISETYVTTSLAVWSTAVAATLVVPASTTVNAPIDQV